MSWVRISLLAPNMEDWQSGLMQQSWKLSNRKVPWVQILHLPPNWEPNKSWHYVLDFIQFCNAQLIRRLYYIAEERRCVLSMTLKLLNFLWLAQFGRASGLGPEGQTFKSFIRDQFKALKTQSWCMKRKTWSLYRIVSVAIIDNRKI